MGNLLESVATPKLQAAYNKYIDTVLNETASAPKATQTLTESQTTEITGNKAASTEQSSSE